MKKTHLILVGGLPGTGKTKLGKSLAKYFDGYIDKDTLSTLYVEKILSILNSNKDDRHSDVYLKNARDIEYQSMMRVAYDNVMLNKSVVCSAPFIKEFTDEAWLQSQRNTIKDIGGILQLIWVEVNETTQEQRIRSRGEPRDQWKLTNWDEYQKNLAGIEKRLPDATLKFRNENECPWKWEERVASLARQILLQENNQSDQ